MAIIKEISAPKIPVSVEERTSSITISSPRSEEHRVTWTREQYEVDKNGDVVSGPRSAPNVIRFAKDIIDDVYEVDTGKGVVKVPAKLVMAVLKVAGDRYAEEDANPASEETTEEQI